MKSKNLYSYPLDKNNIKGVSKTSSPAHILFNDKKTGETYDLRNAIDFVCDQGTPIKAALNGIVVAFVNNLKINWSEPVKPPEDVMKFEETDGNSIIIQHENNEWSVYSHLGYKKVLVRKGQEVKEGDVIGYSGNTGWSTKPHLHFMVIKFTKKIPRKDFISLEVRWRE